MRVLLAALLLAGSCGAEAQTFGGGTFGQDAAVDGASMGPQPAAAPDACGPMPTTATAPLYVLDGSNIDGASNAGLATGDAIATWKNQGSLGATGDATQATSTNRPYVLKGAINGRDAVSFDGTSDNFTFGDSLNSMTSFAATRRGHVVMVVNPNSLPPSAYRFAMANGTSVSAPGFQFSYNATTGLVQALVSGASSTYAFANNVGNFTPGIWRWLEVKANATTFSAQLSGASAQTVSIAGLTTTSPLLTAVTLAAGPSTTALHEGQIAFFAYWADQLSSGDQTAINTWRDCRYGSPTTATKRIVALGDSITVHTTARGARNYSSVIETTLRAAGTSATVGTTAVVGANSTNTLSYWTNQVKTKGFTHVILYIGVNDIDAGTALATIQANIQQVVDEAIVAGMVPIVLSITPWDTYSGSSAGDKANTVTMNTWFTSTLSGTGLIKVNTQSVLGDVSTPANLRAIYDSGDGLHPNDAGQAALGAAIITAASL